MDVSARRHGSFARHDRLSRGRAPLPLARARTQPASPAAALCQLAGARGSPRAAAAETGRLGQVLSSVINQPGDEGHNQRAALPCQSGGTGRSPLATTAGARQLAGHNPRRQAANPGDEQLTCPGHRIVSNPGLLRTARHTANSSSCWPRSSITASAGACHLPTKPWSGPISRACPTTARPTWPMRRRRQSSSGFGRLGPAGAAEVIPSALEPSPRNWWARLEPFRGAAEPDGKPLFTRDPLFQPLDRFHPPQFTRRPSESVRH